MLSFREFSTPFTLARSDFQLHYSKRETDERDQDRLILITPFNNSVTSCQIPLIWKSSIDIPNSKPGTVSSLGTSYRLISLLYLAAKAFDTPSPLQRNNRRLKSRQDSTKGNRYIKRYASMFTQ